MTFLKHLKNKIPCKHSWIKYFDNPSGMSVKCCKKCGENYEDLKDKNEN